MDSPVNVLIIGGGGREAALEHKLREDLPKASLVYVAPGNGGNQNSIPSCTFV